MLLGAVVAAVFTTWPLARFATTRVPGAVADPSVTAWILGWGAHAAIHQPLRMFGANLFHPEPWGLAYSENMLGTSLPLAPVFWLTGNAVLMENLALLLWLAIGGVGAHLLVRRLTGSTAAAALAGVAYATVPYRVSQVPHLHVVAAALAPLAVLACLRLAEPGDRRRRAVAALAATVAIQFWASLTGGVVLLAAVLAWAGWELARHRRRAASLVLRAAAGVGLGLILSLPVVIPYLAVRRAHPEFGHPSEELRDFSATPGSYLLPFSRGPLAAPVLDPLRERFRSDGWWEKQLFPGFWPLAAAAGAALAWALARRRGRPLTAGDRQLAPALGLALALAAVGGVLTLGPRYGGRADGMPLPFAVLDWAGGGLTRVPARFGVLALLGLVVAGAVAVAAVPDRGRRWVVGASAVLLLAELAPSSVPMLPVPRITPAHRALSGRPGTVLALPTAELDGAGNLVPASVPREAVHLYLSTAYFRPLVNGYGLFLPPSYLELVANVQHLPTASSMAILARRGVRTVVVQTAMVVGTPWADVVSRLRAWPGVREVARSPGVVVFGID